MSELQFYRFFNVTALLIRVKMKFNSTEDAIRYVTAAKTDNCSHQVSSAGENLC
jgi:hypothetical protein